MASLRERMSRLLSPKIEAVGLEVGTSALKVVELRAGNPPTLGALAVRPMPPGHHHGGRGHGPRRSGR